jgi:S1-C subfamily serine protease
MKFPFVALALAFSGAAQGAVVTRETPDRWKAIADRLYATVVQVEGSEARQVVARGTGVLIGDGLAVATLHSVAVPAGTGMTVCRDVRVLVPNAGAIDAQVIDALPDLDLALLRLAVEGDALAGAALATELPAVGDRMVALGAGNDEIAGVGVIVSQVEGDVLTLASRRMLDSRFWGGPLFDSNGQLAGIQLTGTVGARAISARIIRALVDRRRGPAGAR